MPEQPDFEEQAQQVIPYLHVSGVRESVGVLKRELAAAYERGLREATEGWQREWAMTLGLKDDWPLHPCTDEDDARRRAAARAGRMVVSRLVGPWEPAEQPEPAREEADRG